MDRKKIAIIGLTGNMLSDQRMQRIACALHDNGWMVQVYYRDFLKYKSKTKANKPQLTYAMYALKTPFKGGIAFYVWFNCLLFIKLIFKKADTYYAVDSDTLPCFTALSYLKSKPLIFDSHEYFAEVPELSTAPFKKKIWHFVTRIGVRRASLCITVGPLLALELERVYNKKFHCIRNVPIRKNTEQSHSYDKPPIILYQGALNKGRMLEMLIESMASLTEFECILAGEGDLSESLRRQAAGLSNVTFAGILSPHELKHLTPTCFAGFNLLDAEGSLSYYFSLSNKYFDYMHAEIPSISSFLPEYIDLNRLYNCGICIENESTVFVECMRNWLNHPEMYAKLKENAKFASASNHWEAESIKLKELIKP